MDVIINDLLKQLEEKKEKEKPKRNTIEKKRKPKKNEKNIYNIIYMSKIFNVYLNSTQKKW